MAAWNVNPAAALTAYRAEQRPIQDTLTRWAQGGLDPGRFSAAQAHYERSQSGLGGLPPLGGFTSAELTAEQSQKMADIAAKMSYEAEKGPTLRRIDEVIRRASSPPATWGYESAASFGDSLDVVGGGTATLGQAPAEWPSAGNPKQKNPAGGSLIPDPVFIVRTSAWPLSMGDHWGMQQKLGWLRAIMYPYLHLSQPKQSLAQAEGLLYQQYAEGGPNRQS
jgi:hypothetical protein